MTEKNYKEERFEFALYVNNNLICKRNFKINNFIPHSMESLDFKETVDEIVATIDDDLKSKSRVYTWYYGDVSGTSQEPLDEFVKPKPEPWECTFKFVITDNKVPVIEKIWDGGVYPKTIRDKVDIANKVVKITNKDGRTYTYDKESFFENNKDRLSPELYCLQGMIMDKQDLLIYITKKICENCSPRENGFKTTSDYTFVEQFGNDKIAVKNGAKTKSKKYNFNIDTYNRKVDSIWGKAVAEKTKAYISTLY